MATLYDGRSRQAARKWIYSVVADVTERIMEMLSRITQAYLANEVETRGLNEWNIWH